MPITRRGGYYFGDFLKKEILSAADGICRSLSDITNLNSFIIDKNNLSFPCGCFCCDNCSLKCNAINTHLYGLNEACRWGGKYIYYCALGLVFCISPIVEDDECVGGIAIGPSVMGDYDDTVFSLDDKNTHEGIIRSLPCITTSQASSVSEILRHLAVSVSDSSASVSVSHISNDYVLNKLYEEKLSNDAYSYPIKYESQIHDLIAEHDQEGALALINELLGHIFLSGYFSFEDMKTRITELIVVLSRSSIDAGGNLNELFLFNNSYIQEIERCDDTDALYRVSGAIIHKYTDYIFNFSHIKYSDSVYKAVRYIREHISDKISINDVCSHVYLSRSSFCKIFKEQTGKSIFDYINYIKIKYAKRLLSDKSIPLVDIALLCGFEDQSYFTKVFKKYTSMSPKKYRDGTVIGNITKK